MQNYRLKINLHLNTSGSASSISLEEVTMEVDEIDSFEVLYEAEDVEEAVEEADNVVVITSVV